MYNTFNFVLGSINITQFNSRSLQTLTRGRFGNFMLGSINITQFVRCKHRQEEDLAILYS